MRELVVLGTSSQVPTRTRNHTGQLLRWDGEGLLVDPGEGTQRQMTVAGVPASSVTRICLTHVHGDHCFGLPGVLSRMALDGVEHPVFLHYPAEGEEVVQALLDAAGGRGDLAVTRRLDLRRVPHGAAGEVADGVHVRPLRHRVATFGYRVQEPDGRTLLPDRLEAAGVRGPDVARLQREGRVHGVRLEDVSVPRRGQGVAVVMDTAECEGADELAEDADLLLVESTYADEEAHLAATYAHLTAGQAGSLGRRAGARTVVLTHFSSRYPSTDRLLEQATATAGDGVEVVAAQDLDRIPLGRRRARGRGSEPADDPVPGPPGR